MDFGKIAYDAYRKAADGKSLITRDPLPEWEQLAGTITESWDAAAVAVLAAAGAPVLDMAPATVTCSRCGTTLTGAPVAVGQTFTLDAHTCL